MTSTRTSYRTIWMSDVHLGTRGCKAEYLSEFLRQHECETLYLVGDLIDGWRLKQKVYWPQEHTNVLRTILGYAKRGTAVKYIPGNHDEVFRDAVGLRFGNVEVLRDDIHVTATGKRLLVVHGDEFDGVTRYAKWLCYVGDWAYHILLTANQWFNWCRRQFGFGYWSLSAYAKKKAKSAANFIASFETNLAAEARRRDCDGVVCGHIHSAQIRDIDGLLYLNDGDFVESCTVLVEHHDGTLEVVQWAQIGAVDPTPKVLYRYTPSGQFEEPNPV